MGYDFHSELTACSKLFYFSNTEVVYEQLVLLNLLVTVPLWFHLFIVRCIVVE